MCAISYLIGVLSQGQEALRAATDIGRSCLTVAGL